MVWCAIKTAVNVHVGESMLNVHLSMNALWGMYAKGINCGGFLEYEPPAGDDALTISAGNIFLREFVRMLYACWQQWV